MRQSKECGAKERLWSTRRSDDEQSCCMRRSKEKEKRSRAARESGAAGNCRPLVSALVEIYFRALVHFTLLGIVRHAKVK